MRTVALALLAAALVVLGVRVFGGAPPAPEAGPAALLARPAVGQAAPRFELADPEGRKVAVGGPSAAWTIVTFYRAAGTPW